jgi:hypothetical protein
MKRTYGSGFGSGFGSDSVRGRCFSPFFPYLRDSGKAEKLPQNELFGRKLTSDSPFHCHKFALVRS